MWEEHELQALENEVPRKPRRAKKVSNVRNYITTLRNDVVFLG
jgi:hypothetical protein